MIRKTIIIALTLASLGACAAWAASYYGIGRERTTYTSPKRQPLPALSIHMSSAMLFQGHLYVERSRIPAAAVSADLEKKIRALFKPGWHLDVGEQLDKNIIGATYPASPWRPIIHRLGTTVVTLIVPLWIVTLLFAAYPAFAFIRGPLRRWRRRHRGLCLKCGYNLEGNVSGVCSECGKAR